MTHVFRSWHRLKHIVIYEDCEIPAMLHTYPESNIHIPTFRFFFKSVKNPEYLLGIPLVNYFRSWFLVSDADGHRSFTWNEFISIYRPKSRYSEARYPLASLLFWAIRKLFSLFKLVIYCRNCNIKRLCGKIVTKNTIVIKNGMYFSDIFLSVIMA